MSIEKVIYGTPKQEKKTKLMMVRLTPSTFDSLKLKADLDHRRPAELARVILERYVDR